MLKIETKAPELQEVCACWWSLPANPLHNTNKGRKDAFALLNSFIKNILIESNETFQIIMLEHASSNYWEEPKLEHFQLVEELRNGNALIPKSARTTNDSKLSDSGVVTPPSTPDDSK
jgi:hypothetical protein